MIGFYILMEFKKNLINCGYHKYFNEINNDMQTTQQKKFNKIYKVSVINNKKKNNKEIRSNVCVSTFKKPAAVVETFINFFIHIKA